MTDKYEEIKKLIMVTLRSEEIVTSEMIREKIALFMSLYKDHAHSIDQETLFLDISTLTSVWQPDPSILRDRKHVNWLPDRKSEIEWNFWKRYRQYLEEEKGWPSIGTGKLDQVTDSILGDIGNPFDDGSWDRRGMVVGDVQSGKTANYTGLICKAVDAGYKLVIVLAGMTNDLRSQTQSRLDAEFLGFESEVGKIHDKSSRIGVGKLADNLQFIAQPLTYSSKDGDFRANKSANLQLGGNPLLLVVKKNTSVLKRILKWVENQGRINPETGKKIVEDIPLLLLDDEADNASVNTKSEDEDPTAINRSIRQILSTFRQSSYVGYTATPFANIFILPDEEENSEFGLDLFPKNFIYYIRPPDNYVGATQIFGLAEDLDGISAEDHSLPLIRNADDSETVFYPKHQKTLRVEYLPESLIEAIKVFVLACAARRVRGQRNVHNSMLIHVTRFNLVQERVHELVSAELDMMRRIIEHRTGAQATAFIKDLQNLWENDFITTFEAVKNRTDDKRITPVTWDSVENELLEAILRIQIRNINGDAGGVLDYSDNPNGLNVIAIGGDKLSRGLTLEGLSVSYYIRPAKNYDTLLQMGRWFGYRPGYLDLCRLYTTEELVSWYQHISVANEELKREFRLMELSNLTPEDYGLKVRTHPGGLNVTAANKIRNGKKMQVSFSGELSQTTVFQKSKELQNQNYIHTEKWINTLGDNHRARNTTKIWENIHHSQIKEFLRNFTTHPLSRKADSDLLIKYIEKLNSFEELKNWTVALISSNTAKNTRIISGHEVGLLKRMDTAPDHDLYMLQKANIISPTDQYLDFSEAQIKEALNSTISAWEERKNNKKPEVPSGPFIRSTRSPENGLLLIYPLDPEDVKITSETVTDIPIIGIAISFPKSRKKDTTVEYQVNTKYWQDRYGEDDDEI